MPQSVPKCSWTGRVSSDIGVNALDHRQTCAAIRNDHRLDNLCRTEVDFSHIWRLRSSRSMCLHMWSSKVLLSASSHGRWAATLSQHIFAVTSYTSSTRPSSERTKTFRPQCFTHVNCATEVMGQDTNKGLWAYVDHRMDVCNIFCALSLTF